MFGLDRGRGHDPFLRWKVGIFSAGAVLAMAGIALEERWVTGTAIVVLLAGVALRFFPPSDDAAGLDDAEDEEGPEAPDADLPDGAER